MAYTFTSSDWLMEKSDPGVRYVAMRDLVGVKKESREFEEAKTAAYKKGPISQILEAMNPEGYWVRPGGGYNPKYYSAVWSLTTLSQTGAKAADDKRIEKACKYYLDHAFTKDGSLSYNGTPSGTIDCLEGNMSAALTDLEFEDERLEATWDWMARSVTGDIGKYYAYNCGPVFACGPNGKKPCAWGGTKVLLALAKVPRKKQSAAVRKAIKKSAEFLFSRDPLKADYPTRQDIAPSRNWWKFGFPVFYITDLLQTAESLALAGYGSDPRLAYTIEFIRSRQDESGRYNLEYDYKGKTWGNFGEKNKPNKWVTYRVLRFLKLLGE